MTKRLVGRDDLRQYGFIDYNPGQLLLLLLESLHKKNIFIEEVWKKKVTQILTDTLISDGSSLQQKYSTNTFQSYFLCCSVILSLEPFEIFILFIFSKVIIFHSNQKG